MKKATMLLLAVFLLLAATPMIAQTQEQYKVKVGDTLAGLAEKNLNSEAAWETIYAANPFLREPGRRYVRNGITYVLIHPGESLAGLTKEGVVEKVTKLDEQHVAIAIDKTPDWVKWLEDWWWLILLLVLVIVAVMYIARGVRRDEERLLNQDPVRSGPPMVQEGVTDATAPTHFQNMAARQWEQETGRTATSTQLFRIVNSVPGRIWGRMTVSYANGINEDRRLSGQRAYRAEVEFPDGNTETLYMLQGCGNDLRYGGIHRYLPQDDFRFEQDVLVPVVPVQAVTPAVVEQTAPVAVPTEAIPVGEVRVSLRPAVNGQPMMVTMAGVDLTGENGFTVNQNGDLTIRCTPRRAQ